MNEADRKAFEVWAKPLYPLTPTPDILNKYRVYDNPQTEAVYRAWAAAYRDARAHCRKDVAELVEQMRLKNASGLSAGDMEAKGVDDILDQIEDALLKDQR